MLTKNLIEPVDAEAGCRLLCSGVWGGIRNVDQDVRAGPMIASLYSRSCDGGRGGDIYYFGVCRDELVTRVAVADVVGHGETVSEISQYVYEALNAGMCDADGGAILAKLNRLASRRGLSAMTTAAVISCDAARGEFLFTYAGHPPALLRRRGERAWSVAASEDVVEADRRPPADLPLAVLSDPVYHRHVVPMRSGDRLFIHSDGLTEAPNRTGEHFGGRRLREVLAAGSDATPSQLKSSVLDAVQRHTGGDLSHDDVTLIVADVR